MTASKSFLIGVVGPCGAGKSTLIEALDTLGYSTRHIAQEHSYVKDMWKRITNPDVLIFLQVSYSTSQKRRHMNWVKSEYDEQQRRLSHAREHANFYVDTDNLSIEEVLEQVLTFLKTQSDHSENPST
jgi:guanylate kinase